MRNEIEKLPEWNVAMERYTSAYPQVVADEMIDTLVSQILSLLEGIVPPEKEEDKYMYNLWVQRFCKDYGLSNVAKEQLKTQSVVAEDVGYNQCRQDMLDKINCYRTDTLSYNQARQDYLDNLDNLEGKS